MLILRSKFHPNRITLSFIPAGNEQVASSRIRVYCILDALHRRHVRFVIGYDSSADALIVQKRLTAEVLEAVRECKRRRKLVIYDCDDIGPILNAWAPQKLRREMIRSAELVTTNSAGFRAALLGRYRARKVELIPDAIDYFLKAPFRPTISTVSPLRLLWFGNRRNLALLERYADVLKSVPKIRLLICTDFLHVSPGEKPASLSAAAFRRRLEFKAFRHPSFSFLQWDLNSFPTLLRSCDLSILPHDGSAGDRAKSNNRMIASIAWGTPVIASRTPAYEATARQMGLSECLFDKPEDVPALIESLRSASARRRYLKLSQPWVWKHHSADVVAEKLCDAIERNLKFAERTGVTVVKGTRA
jgi:glycosyltransferase involved in cell wall biosynthesis